MIAGAYGGLLTDSAIERRTADVVMRVGTPELDNTHGQSRASGMTSGTLPLNDNADATERILWELTDREYKRAAPAYLNVKTNTAVRAEEEDKSPDFSKEVPKVHVGEKLTQPAFDKSAWEAEIRRVSAGFSKYPGRVLFDRGAPGSVANSRMVTSEGSSLALPGASARLVMEAQTRADDGMDLLRVETFQAPTAIGIAERSRADGKN